MRGSSLDVLEIDGASNRGIEDIKTIQDSVGYSPAHGRWKVYIIDEVHMLTKEAFNALLKTLEEPPPNVKFFFATTEAHKIPATILSRCQRFNLRRLSLEAITSKLHRIATELGLKTDSQALERIALFSEGGLRDAESLFDQIIAFADGEITQEVVQEVLGLMPQELLSELDQATVTGDIRLAFRLANDLFSQGKDLHYFLEELYQHYKSLLQRQLAKEKDATSIITPEQCLRILEMIAETASAMKTAISQSISLESLLIRIIRIRLRVPVEVLTKELRSLQQKLAALKEAPQPAPAPTPAPTETVVREPDMQKKARYDTLIQFAAVELDATVQRKTTTDVKRK